MKREEFKNRFANEIEVHERKSYVNPLEIMENYYFNQRDDRNYEEKAVNRCIDEKVNFVSTANNIYKMAYRFITVKCPICGSDIEGKSGGGTANNHHINFRCECKFEAILTLPEDGIEFKFKENR